VAAAALTGPLEEDAGEARAGAGRVDVVDEMLADRLSNGPELEEVDPHPRIRRLPDVDEAQQHQNEEG
jgi:hypothetical protein